MKAKHRSTRPRGRRNVSLIAAGSLMAGLLATGLATAAETTKPGDLHAWGIDTANGPWVSGIDNADGPFVDVAVAGASASTGDHTTAAVTEGGGIVIDGDYSGLATDMPAQLASETVTSIDFYFDVAVASTATGEIFTWGGMPAPSTECAQLADGDGIRDLDAGGRDLSDEAYGVLVSGAGELCVWGTGISRVLTPPADVSDVVKVEANRYAAVALTGSGDVVGWGQAGIANVSEEVLNANVVDIAVGHYFAVALTDEGRVLTWGNSAPTFPEEPGVSGKFVKLAELSYHDNTMAAATDRGEIVVWGGNSSSDRAALQQIPDDVAGKEILALGISGPTHIAAITGDDLDLEEPVTVTAQPSVEGQPVVGATLTATPATFSETDGVDVTHQWYASEGGGAPVPIDGATETTLELTSEHVGQTITYTTTAQRGDDAAVVSDPSNAIGPVVEVLEDLAVDSQPTLALADGATEPRVGVTIEATPATFTPDVGLTVEHQWFRDGDPIDGVDTSTYTLTADDLGADITYRTHAVRDADEQEATSELTEAVGPVLAVELAFVDPPVIEGNGYVGKELTVVPGTTTDDDNVTNTFEWTVEFDDEREPIQASGESFTLTEEHRGGSVSVEQTATRGDESIQDTSLEVGPVGDEPAELTVVSPSTISGGRIVGEELVGSPATFSETEGVSLSYQWVVNLGGEDPIPAELGEDGKARLTLTDDHVNQVFHFETVATRDGEAEPAATSRSASFIGVIVKKLDVVADPSIAGTARVGEELTVGDRAEFTAAPPTVSISYRWLDADSGDELGTGESLMLTDEHVGRRVELVARASGIFQEVFATSDTIGPVQEPVPPLTVVSASTISGGRIVGEELVGSPATFSETEGVSLSYQWVVNLGGEDPIPAELGEDGKARLTLNDDHVNQVFHFETVATRDGEAEPAATSRSASFIGVIVQKLDVVADPSIAGTARVGEELTVGDPAEFTVGRPTISINYRWLDADSGDELGTGESLMLTDDHVGRRVELVARASGIFQEVFATSDAIGPIQLETPLEIDGQPVLESEDPRVGVELTATPATFSETDGVDITHRWFSDGVLIEGADSASFTPRSEDVDKTIGYQTVGTRTIDEMVVASDTVEVGPIAEAPAPPTGGEGDIQILSQGPFERGDEIEVMAGEEYAGEEVSPWLFSDPLSLGTVTVGANGTFTVTIPNNAALGGHRLAVYGANGQLIGFDTLTIVDPNAGGGTGAPGGGGSGVGLPGAGAEVPLALVPLSILLMIGGAAVLVVGRRELQ